MLEMMKYWSISSQEISTEAEKMWFSVEIIDKESNLFYVISNKKSVLFKSVDFWENSALWFKLCADKKLTYKILEKDGLPTAKSYYLNKKQFETFKSNNIDNLKYPLIIKPLDEAHGDWVMMAINTFHELHEKLKKSFKRYENMIVQEEAQWDEVRVLVVKWDVILARNRIPASVIWNGIKNIQELINQENNNPLRGDWYNLPLSFIKVDDELLSFIWKKWQDLNYIPKNEEVIQLRWNSNIWTWGTMINVTDKMHESTKKICINTARSLWLWICGIDILSTDISKPLNETWGIILEVGATPWLWWERELTWVNTAKEILKKVFN